jgi:hypothetical protein
VVPWTAEEKEALLQGLDAYGWVRGCQGGVDL